jgi:Na+-translocating ferredoxin:NAD+ oxidoreductase RnfG subunit
MNKTNPNAVRLQKSQIERRYNINKMLLIIAVIAAICCLFGTITYLIAISNEIQNPDIEDNVLEKNRFDF